MYRQLHVVCVASALAAFSGSAYAQLCLNVRDVRADNAYSFSFALVDSLEYAKTAVSHFPANPPQRPSLKDSVEFIEALKLAQRDYDCSASLLQPYKESTNESIAQAASGAYLAYAALAKLSLDSISQHKQLLDAKAGTQAGALAEQVATLNLKIADAWNLLPIAVTGATFALFESPKDAREKVSTLVLTAKERDALKGQLRKTFGAEVARGPKADQYPLEASAAALYAFLNNRTWKTRQ